MDTTLPAGSAVNPLMAIFQALGNIPGFGITKQPPAVNQGPAWQQPFVGPLDAGMPVTVPSLPAAPSYDPTPFQFRSGPPAAGTVWPQLPPLKSETPPLPVPSGGNPLLGIMQGLQALDRWKSAEAGTEQIGRSSVEPFPVEGTPLPTEPTAPAAAADEGLFVPYAADALPTPPVIDAPPGMNMDRLKDARRDSILGSMALGAAQVDATEPGSFARTLAAAGGAGAAASGDAAFRMEEISHKNALAAYEAAFKNKELEYGHALKMHELMTPNIKATDDSIVIQDYNKEKGGYNVRVIKTGGLLADAEKLGKFIEGMGATGPVAQNLEVEYIAKQFANDPAALQGTLLRTAMERTAREGLGEAVFGDKYTDAMSKVKIDPGLMNKPDELRRESAKQVAAMLLADPELVNDPTWLAKASEYGIVAANILSKANNARATN